jgi:flagellar hook-associated protein 3 FlgL
MRIATSVLHQGAVNSMLAQQAQLARTQNQLATGRRVQTPADDPSATAHIYELERSLAAAEQYGKNSVTVRNRLGLEEQSLADATTIVQRVRELTLQANNGVLDASNRELINSELRQRIAELVDTANRRDAAGEYLFAGYATQTQPFALGPTGATYYGDRSDRSVQIGPTQRVIDSHSGFEAFMNIPVANGIFTTAVGAANTGGGIIDAGSVVNPAAWQPGTYQVQFLTSTSYQVVDAGATVVASGTYTSAAPIEFRGIRVTISGAVAAGDGFTVATAGRQSVFATLQSLVATVAQPNGTPAERARSTTQMGQALVSIDAVLDKFSALRAEVGARLAALDLADTAREDMDLEIQSTLSTLRDVDYAEAVSRMNQQMAGLQAAQASYARIAQLSLFDYL